MSLQLSLLWQYPHPHLTQVWFCFQSSDRSAGRIYLRMIRLIRFLPTLCFLDPDNGSIVNRSRRLTSKWNWLKLERIFFLFFCFVCFFSAGLVSHDQKNFYALTYIIYYYIISCLHYALTFKDFSGFLFSCFIKTLDNLSTHFLLKLFVSFFNIFLLPSRLGL